ncbi:tryptophan-rich sensory protein [Dactylosporangium sp. NBC_01737]|uniref:TspO/MBR family protein n=1 Tax=Dactylosporangium sp. NBC_01737 TaxID=2975959 RepID=UPI002E14028C|nr:tryptophan-rich sensory protein [Dactylosporangium sp. NBC_01737]
MTLPLPHHHRPQWVGLLGFGAAAAAAALVGGLGVAGTAGEYDSLAQPSWAPPSWLFGPVWTVLYCCIAVSGWLVWRRSGWNAALTVFAAQLVLNAIWTPLFFGAGLRGPALVDIVALWVLIGVNIAVFWRRSRLAAGLLLPYWAWVTFATALNASVWWLNR